MYRKSDDKRVRQSTEKLYQAILALLNDKSFEDIGIKEVCDKASIGRATFYRNFDYVEDIMRYKLSLYVDELQALHDKYMNDCNCVLDELELFCDFWVKNGDFLQTLHNTKQWPLFVEQITTATQIKLQDKITEFGLSDVQKAYFQDAVLSSITTMLHTWINLGKVETAKELALLFELPFRMFTRFNRHSALLTEETPIGGQLEDSVSSRLL
jgi:AcrR family transcriptional regulator